MRYDDFTMLPHRAFRAVGGPGFGYRMTLEGSKDDSPPPPDYSPLANASKESAEIMAGLGREQLDETRRQYENNMAVTKPVIDAQLGIMRQTQEQGADYYDYLKSTFRPIEEGLAKDAQDFSEAGAREQFARTAAADLEQQQANEQAQSDRAMVAMGVSPNSGRFAGLKRSQAILNAGARAGAVTDARVKADALGTAKRMDVVGLSRNLPGASTAAYSVATGAGNSAVGNQNATSGQYLNGMQGAAGLTAQGLGMQQSGLSTIAGLQSSNYGTALANSGSDLAGLGALVGAGAKAYGTYMTGGWGSSKKIKTDKTPISEEAALYGLQRIPVEQWKYKPGVEDSGTHVGPYAEDVQRQFGDRVAPGGKMIDAISMNGVTIAAVKGLAKKVAGLERAIGLERISTNGRVIDGEFCRDEDGGEAVMPHVGLVRMEG